MFTTDYLSLTEKSILFLRNRYPYREIVPSQIQKIELTKGTDLKRPVLALIFGACLIFAGTYLIANYADFDPSDLRTRGGAKSIGYMIILEMFLVCFGGYAIFSAVPVHPVIRFTLTSGESESLSISDIIKNKKVEEFLKNLNSIVDNRKIIVNPALPL